MCETIDAIKALPRADPDAALLVPGERGARTLDERLTAGIPLPDKPLTNLRRLAENRGVTLPDEL